ncbi:Grainyhead-like protein 2-like protein [Colletotrichum sidae]|uniref:Grainyhead-like protein 2-like protein n=1 Tax=Colletotrichum sidae TaxID=1347389 RepID=A0A4R8TAX8_9PEZI|nr:Grainyhead-like protein 2-like protein [Colletotrichum sidae]
MGEGCNRFMQAKKAFGSLRTSFKTDNGREHGASQGPAFAVQELMFKSTPKLELERAQAQGEMAWAGLGWASTKKHIIRTNLATKISTLSCQAVANPSHSLSHEAFRDQDPTPRATNEPWRFTPSLLDPNSFSFTNFANAPPGCYTPTPGGTNTIYHPQAGDLHTPTLGLGMGLGTPLSMPTSEGAMHSGQPMMDLAGYQGMHPQHPQQFQHQHFNPFIQPAAPQQSFAPSTFVHQDTGYETMEQDGSPMTSDPSEERITSIDSAFHNSPMVGFQGRQFAGMPMSAATLPPSAEKFRFHATLNAPTAMIKQADEIPVTYLNKGQAYSLSIVDTNATIPVAPGTKFRTFVRISFEDEQQRQKPGVCWALWKEGRGTNEAHQRGGKLQAVEYVEAGQPTEGDDKRTRIELESASFDGFCVVWTPGINGAPECNIAVRFNFLSTDFSHSKGVKGIPVRLCAKTHTVPLDPTQPAADANPEISFCKVKLFRDHGAERKLSNDVAHFKKTIDKLKQQIAQAESGMKDFGKRKRSTASSQVKGTDRPGKVQKHKRTWSMSSTSSAGGARPPLEEDLHYKLQTLQDMFTSTRPVSVLYLRGEDLDDPDLHPVSLPGEQGDVVKTEFREGPAWQARSGRSSVAGSSLVSPSPSSLSLASQASVVPNRQWSGFDGEGSGEPVSSRQGSDQPTKVSKTDDAGNLSGWIEALGVDASYRPPPERVPKPVACFYVIRPTPSEPERRAYYKAIYLAERNLKDFNYRIAAKWNLDPSKIVRTVHALDRGLEVEMDDDVIREMREGQDMMLEIRELADDIQPKREWDMVVDQTEGDAMDQSPASNGYELRLTF